MWSLYETICVSSMSVTLQESICEDVVSVEISSVHIALAIAELKDAIESLQSEIEDTRNELVSSFLAILSKDSTTWDQVVLSLKLTLIS